MQRRAAFTLIELSIVLVVIGLLVGGVMLGQSLVRASEVRSVAEEYQKYVSAISNFQEKYNAFPGDFYSATKIWGSAAGGTADGVVGACYAVTTAAVGTETCNGNGDGLLPNLAVGGTYNEFWRAWQHLANAGLIEGKFSGVTGPGSTYDATPGVNAPRSKLGGAMWTMWSLGSGVYAGASYFSTAYGNLMYYGVESNTAMNYNNALKAEEAFNIDTKIDDGKPQMGNMLSHPNLNRPNCINASNDAYLISDTSEGCSIIFKTGFGN